MSRTAKHGHAAQLAGDGQYDEDAFFFVGCGVGTFQDVGGHVRSLQFFCSPSRKGRDIFTHAPVHPISYAAMGSARHCRRLAISASRWNFAT